MASTNANYSLDATRQTSIYTAYQNLNATGINIQPSSAGTTSITSLATAARAVTFPDTSGTVLLVNPNSNVVIPGTISFSESVAQIGGDISQLFNTASFIKANANGVAAPWNLFGIQAGVNGQYMLLYNNTGQNMIINNESGSAAAVNMRITTGTGASVTAVNGKTSCFVYDNLTSRWLLMSFV